MAVIPLNERFFTSTRGKIVLVLRRGRRTVDELAGELGLTNNAIRAHLTTLERDRLVMQGEPRRGGGKPAFTYELTLEAEQHFPKAYGTLLQQLLEVLGGRLPRETVATALREVGHRIAMNHGTLEGALPQRVEAALAVLGNLGGLAQAEDHGASFLIQGYSCPLAAAVAGNPDTCLLAETLLADLIGAPVRQLCDPGPPPCCRFEVAAAD
jgi:predicted ArsR family transcriptional regulator